MSAALSLTPFPNDPDRHAIWEMLVPRDIRAFVEADWALVADDFVETGFYGLDAQHEADPDRWRMAFPTLDAYRTEWLRQAHAAQDADYAEDLETAVHRATRLTEIEISGDMAIARKKFDGEIRCRAGAPERLNWQTLYVCRRTPKGWRIAGFTGYLPYASTLVRKCN